MISCSSCGGKRIVTRARGTPKERIECADCNPPLRSKASEWPRILKVNEAIVKRTGNRKSVHTWRILLCDNTLQRDVAVIVHRERGGYRMERIPKSEFKTFGSAKAFFYRSKR